VTKRRSKATSEPLNIPDFEVDSCEICGLGIWREVDDPIRRCKEHGSSEFRMKYDVGMARTLETILISRGLRAGSMYGVAVKCLEADWENVRRALMSLGYRYSFGTNCWLYWGG
jgi:hypothetical protein